MTYPCKKCDKVFSLKHALISHKRYNHKKYQCNICNIELNSEEFCTLIAIIYELWLKIGHEMIIWVEKCLSSQDNVTSLFYLLL